MDMQDREKKQQYVMNTMKVHQYHCNACKHTFAVAVSTSDTDMTPFYFSSVYAISPQTLVIAELTTEEYYVGCQERMPKRIEAYFTDRTFYYIDYHNICPVCGQLLQKEQVLDMQTYLKYNTTVYLCCLDKDTKKEMFTLLQA